MMRDIEIDILKTLAILGVITIHISSSGFAYKPLSIGWLSALFYAVLTRASVPIFFMSSGALLLNPEKDISIKDVFTKYLPRIIIPLFAYAIFYQLFNMIATKSFDINSVYSAIKNILVFNHEFHLYYLHIMIIVYLFLPLSRLIVKYATKKEFEYLLAIWFIFGILYPNLKYFAPIKYIGGITTQYGINMTYSAIGYGLCGYYLKKYNPYNKNTYNALFIFGFIIVYFFTAYLSSISNSLNEIFLEGMSPAVAFMAIGLFGSAICMCNKYIKYSSIFAEISKASFSIYLNHVLFIYIFRKIGISISFAPLIISIPAVVLANFACSYTTYKLISKIPIANKYLV